MEQENPCLTLTIKASEYDNGWFSLHPEKCRSINNKILLGYQLFARVVTNVSVSVFNPEDYEELKLSIITVSESLECWTD